MDAETQAAIDGIYNGTLAYSIKKNAKYALTGIAIGMIAGVMVAGLMGKGKLMFGLAGAVAGGSLGYIITPKK